MLILVCLDHDHAVLTWCILILLSMDHTNHFKTWYIVTPVCLDHVLTCWIWYSVILVCRDHTPEFQKIVILGSRILYIVFEKSGHFGWDQNSYQFVDIWLILLLKRKPNFMTIKLWKNFIKKINLFVNYLKKNGSRTFVYLIEDPRHF